MSSVAVVYLVWVPLGLPPVERFLASYALHPAEVPHELVVLFNGHQTQDELAPFYEKFRALPYTSCPIDTPQQDIASYLFAAHALSHDYLCFLNSYSELQAHGWLQKLYSPHATTDVGLTGATASWESHQIVVPLRQLRTWLCYRLHNRRWPAFPNPHIRTTGFMLKRENMLRLTVPPVRTKMDAYGFESGFHSMTQQIQSWNLKALLVDKDGRGFEPLDWARTLTFRSGDQRLLLLSDNRTQEYAQADAVTQREWSRRAWGDAAPPSPSE